MKPSEKLAELNITLPEVAKPAGSYIPAISTGKLIITAGQLPTENGKLICEGRVGENVTLDQAQKSAELAALNALAAAVSIAGGIDNIVKIIRVNVFVSSAPTFYDQAKVANGVSELFAKIFGDAAQHTRCAIGAAVLPLNSPVEVDITVEVK